MLAKNPAIILKQVNGALVDGKRYEVKVIVGSTSYDIGQIVTEAKVKSMIDAGWKVKIV
jgi:hypothetical protein